MSRKQESVENTISDRWVKANYAFINLKHFTHFSVIETTPILLPEKEFKKKKRTFSSIFRDWVTSSLPVTPKEETEPVFEAIGYLKDTEQFTRQVRLFKESDSETCWRKLRKMLNLPALVSTDT